jgi:type VI secretion system protein ImpG
MALIDFYEREIRYFLEESARFARAHPDQARALNLEEVRDRDPYVERLIEAFAFLSGSVRQRISDDFSEIALELLETVRPACLHPLPASVIMEMAPMPGRVRSIQTLEKGAVIASGPVSTELPCLFTTCGPLDIFPLETTRARMASRRDGRSALRLTLSPFSGGIEWEGLLRGHSLRFYIHGDPGFAFSLYYLLLNDVAGISVSWRENGERKEAEASASVLSSALSAPEGDHPLLPYPDHSFPGFGLLEEYFFFPEKLRFVDLDLMDVAGTPDDGGEIDIDFILSGREEWRVEPHENNFRLNCVAAVNLFPKSAEPIYYDESRPYHRISPDHAAPGHYASHHVTRVGGMRLNSSTACDYPAFVSRRRSLEGESDCYHVKRREGVDGRPELLLGIVRPGGLGPEVISADLMCGNDPVVREVRLGDISRPYRNFPDFVQARNLTVPRMPAWPDFKGDRLWSLVNILSLNYMSLDSPGRLRGMLSLFDRSGSLANERRIGGIQGLRLEPAEELIHGCPVRGISMALTLDKSRFANRGDMLMFSGVLSRVMAMYSPINSFCRLRMEERDSERTYEWPIKGERSLM